MESDFQELQTKFLQMKEESEKQENKLQYFAQVWTNIEQWIRAQLNFDQFTNRRIMVWISQSWKLLWQPGGAGER